MHSAMSPADGPISDTAVVDSDHEELASGNGHALAMPKRSWSPRPEDVTDYDLLPGPRDGKGNQLPTTTVYRRPVPGTFDLPGSELEVLLTGMAHEHPVPASYLRHFYQERIRPAYLRVAQVRSEEERYL